MKPVPAAHPRGWLRADDVVRHALAAYYAICREVDKDGGECPGDAFTDDVARVFELRLHDHGYRAGLPDFESECGELLARRFGPPVPDPPASAPRRLRSRAGRDIHCHLYKRMRLSRKSSLLLLRLF